MSNAGKYKQQALINILIDTEEKLLICKTRMYNDNEVWLCNQRMSGSVACTCAVAAGMYTSYI